METVADELYALLPSEFTAARDDRARAARREGDRELARRISALRKPTLAAWAANLLIRVAPDETDRFLALGEELRRAYRDLDGDQLRELARTQRQLVAALSRKARDAAAEAGQAIGDGAQREVEQTLQAVLADPEAAEQWSAGRLSKPLTPPTGFTTTGLRAVPSGPGPSKTGKAPKAPKAQPSKPAAGHKRTEKAEATELDKARERRRRREQEAEEARRTADEAAEEARRRADERADADGASAAAKDRRKAADDRLRAARDELADAEREQQAAADAEREARDRAQDAAHAAREAERTARRAADRADRLSARRRSKR